MNGNSRDRLLRDLQDEEARAAYVEGHVRAGVAYQIRAMRDTEGWSQTELGQEMGNTPQAAQAAVARLENPDYGRFSVSTLLSVASAFDVALLVRFVSYSDFLRQVTDAPPSALSPVAYTHDVSAQPQSTILTESPVTMVTATNIVSTPASISSTSTGIFSTVTWITAGDDFAPPVSLRRPILIDAVTQSDPARQTEALH